jgi:hypothetical protein
MRAGLNRFTPNLSFGREETRFAELAGASWRQLPAPVRRRFSRHLGEGERLVYLGEVASTRLTFLGRLIALLARAVGAPLPLEASCRVPVTVIVTGCERLGGQVWTRIYERISALPQVIQSVKRFGGATGLEEIVGGGVGMRLRLSVRDRALVFTSAGYFLRVRDIEISLPGWLTPGVIEVVHREESPGRFSFSLSVKHPIAGDVIEQIAFFREDPSP